MYSINSETEKSAKVKQFIVSDKTFALRAEDFDPVDPVLSRVRILVLQTINLHMRTAFCFGGTRRETNAAEVSGEFFFSNTFSEFCTLADYEPIYIKKLIVGLVGPNVSCVVPVEWQYIKKHRVLRFPRITKKVVKFARDIVVNKDIY